jgi:hypothetical protein
MIFSDCIIFYLIKSKFRLKHDLNKLTQQIFINAKTAYRQKFYSFRVDLFGINNLWTNTLRTDNKSKVFEVDIVDADF